MGGVTRYSVGTGNWSSTSTWAASSGGSSGQSVPGTGDNAIIESGFTVTIDVNVSVASVTVQTSGGLSTSTFTLTTSGNFTWNSSVITAATDLTINGDLDVLSGKVEGASGRNHTIQGNVLVDDGGF